MVEFIKKIADILQIDLDNPYLEVYEIKKNKKFVAKESNTFDEEKNVALKVKNKLSQKKILFIENSGKLNLEVFFSNFQVLKEKINLLNESLSKQVNNLLNISRHWSLLYLHLK